MGTARLKVLLDDGSGIYEQLGSTLSQSFSQKRLMEFDLQNTSAVLWDSNADGALADFDLVVIWADAPVDLEFTTNDGDAAEELSSVRLAANVPLILGADDSYYNHSASDAFAGTLDVLDRIRADEPNNVAASIHVLMFT